MIKKILKKIRALININLIDYKLIEAKLNKSKIDKCYEEVTFEKDSKFYVQAEVINLQRNKEKIKVGNNTHIRGSLLIFGYGGKISIGHNSYIGFGTQIWSAEEISIGNSVLISHNCNIIDTNTHEEDYLERQKSFLNMLEYGHPKEKQNVRSAPIIINDHVWISFNVTILKGVTIGKGAIVAASSVVTKDVPEFVLVAGNPARIIKTI